MSSTVFVNSSFSVHVPSTTRPDLPRCHLRRRDDGSESILGLPLLDLLAGPPVSAQERLTVLGHLQLVLDEWERLHG